jgi:cytochrome c oxidase subunit 3
MMGVQACAALFLVIKIVLEWIPKMQHHLVPWAPFYYSGQDASPEVARLFFNFYFGMTGLHGFHILVGMIVIGGIQVMILRKHPNARDYVLTEMVGLYWHFVDIVWIFLYPMFYLMSK